MLNLTSPPALLTPTLSHFPPPGAAPRRVTVTVVRSTSEDDDNTHFTLNNDIHPDKLSAVNQKLRNFKPSDALESEPEPEPEPEPELESPQPQPLLDNIGLEFDSENAYILVLYGGGSLVALWLLSAVVGAIDSIPVLPQLLEVIGLGYSIWFSTRYLLFKKNREELSAKVKELKSEVLGSGNNGVAS